MKDNPKDEANLTPNSFPEASNQTEEKNEQSKSLEKIIVDIKGNVVKPGIYEMDHDARVHEAIDLAGGFNEKAEQTAINLAQKIQDEMVIYVPAQGEVEQSQVNLSDSDSNQSKIRINSATADEIESLNGIGPSKAQAIIDYREENGLFQSVEDLLEVPGIGEKTLENLKEDIQVP